MKYPFTKCLNPQRIRNPHTEEWLTVPCGHCDVCNHSKGMRNSLKCKLESLSHKYCMFITLTYDNDSIPRIQLIENDEVTNLYYAVVKNERIGEGEILFELELDDNAKTLLSEKFQNVCPPVLYKKDAQLFIKRFRKHLSKVSNEKIRYYIIGEYGPVHYRPHLHALLWFDGEETFQNFGDILNRSWKFGRVDWSLASGNALNYVAQYVNSSVALPRIFTFDETQPFALHSFYLGESVLASESKKLTEENFKDFVRRGFHFNGRFTEFTLWRSFESRFFPKCHRFGSLNEFERVQAYRAYECARDWTNETSLTKQANIIFFDLESLDYRSLLEVPILKYFFVYYDGIKFNFQDIEFRKKLYRQIYMSLSLSKHFLYKVCQNQSLTEIRNKISFIDSFYKWKDMQALKNQILIEIDIAKTPNISNINLGLCFDIVEPKSLDLQNDFASFVMTNEKDIYEESELVKQYRAESVRITHDSIKHKKLNDLNNIFTNL